MDFSQIAVFRLAGLRLDYLAERQKLIAENVVNANTPQYKARDLKSFETILGGMQPVVPVRTAPMHLAAAGTTGPFREDRSFEPRETTPSGNAVSLEQEMAKGSETRDAFALTTGLFHRNLQMLRMAWRAGG
ncbi:flagellar basal body rod protein FlgG [Azospirillum halopraeferens]|uniref:flagellar basal body rod protein FlgG n=1 Tax=Azospirillum halopraeferens TaxID=34010 RepID=UPI0004061D6A|nr:flagellar basal body rod protein FlgG [Azospirillum halopraeferens]